MKPKGFTKIADANRVGSREFVRRGWVIVHPDGRLELDYFYHKSWGEIRHYWPEYRPGIRRTSSEAREIWRKHYRPDCEIVRGTVAASPNNGGEVTPEVAKSKHDGR